MRWNALVLLLGVTVASCARIEEEDGLIEPRLNMIDRSPPIGNPRRPTPTGNFEDFDPNFDEAISFSVNTRGELGPTRAPLMCHCKVMTSTDSSDEEGQASHHGRSIPRRSFSAPELREHVPLVTREYAHDHDEIAFGVNVRGELGPDYNPTWCNCKILESHGPQGEADDDDEEESASPHAIRRGSPNAASNPHVRHGTHPVADTAPAVEALQVAEGAAVVAPAPVLAPAQTLVNALQVSEGTTTRGISPHRHHRWNRGVDVPAPRMTVPSEPVATEYSYRGRHLGHPAPAALASQILTQIDEGPDDSMPSQAAKEADGATVLNQENATVAVDVMQTVAANVSDVAVDIMNAVPTNDKVEEPSPSVSVSSSPSPSPSPSTVDEDNDADPVVALQHLAHSHPHASALLAQAIQAAAIESQERIHALEDEIARRDEAIRQLSAESEKTQAQLKYVLEMESKRLLTDSPSPSPSTSLSPSVSASPSPSPSPSPSAQLEWVPQQEARHRPQPRQNKKACYHNCRDTNCTPLFESSLRQYAACMDDCALKCYGSV